MTYPGTKVRNFGLTSKAAKFINTSKKVPQSYKRFYENILRKKFSLIGVPVQLDFISAKNPYIKKN